MKVVLELQDQPSNIKKVTVRHDIVIGRGADCNLRLSAPQVSRRHCFLRIGAEGAYISDLESSNGTFLDSKKLCSGKRYELQDGAVLAVGPVKFVARVLSEVMAGEVIDIKVTEDQVDANSVSILEDAAAPVDFDARIADVMPDEIISSMNFAVENGGPSAGEDEQTADYVSAEAEDSNYFRDVDEIKSSESPSVQIPAVDSDFDDDEPSTMTVDADEFKALLAPEAEAELDGDDEIETVEVEEDDEILAIDDDDVNVAPQEKLADGDEESELRNFLNGLD